MRALCKHTALFALAAALLGSATISTAEEVYYRWINERGFPMLSDRPPPKGIDYEVISTGSSFKRPVDASEGAVPAEVEPSPGNEFTKVETQESAVKKNPEFCARAKENLATLNSSARIRMRNEAGEIAYIDEEEKERQRKRAQDTIKIHCD
jgi:hypothetical protein